VDSGVQLLAAIGGFVLFQFVIYPAIAKAWQNADKDKLAARFKSVLIVAAVGLVVYSCATGNFRGSSCLNARYEVC